MWLRQSTAGTWKLGPFMDQTSGTGTVTNLTLTPSTIRLSKNGGNFASSSSTGTGVHDESGFYDVAYTAADVGSLGRLKVMVHQGALPVWDSWTVLPADVYDSLAGTNNLPTGTAENVLNIPAITEGTIGLAVQVNTGTVLRAVSAGTIDRANSVPNPSGGTVELSVQVNTGTVLRAVTVGTSERANSVPNPSGGTVDLVSNLGTLPSIDSVGTVGNLITGSVAVANLVNTGTLDYVVNTGTLLQSLSRGEPGQGNPAATLDSFSKQDYLYKWSRNKKTQDGTNTKFFNDAGDTVDQKSSDSDDGTTATIGEIVTGP